MPTKKTTKKVTKKTSGFDFERLVNGSDSYKSLIYGIITVVVLFVVIALGIRTLQQNRAEIDDRALSTQNLNLGEAGDKYTVAEGDTLWSIAEKSYRDGNKWGEIAKANNIADASNLEKGTKLTIPKIELEKMPTEAIKTTVTPSLTISPTVAVSPTLTPTSTVVKATITPTVAQQQQQVAPAQKIGGNTYKIVSGDTLWDISVRAYGNGYRWVEIAKLNNVQNPNLIYPDVTINLPRP